MYVANYLKNEVQVVDIEQQLIIQEIKLGPTPELTLARRGMELFYDGQRSLDQWYSCHSCHQNGGVNAKAMDTFNDGSPRTMKTVLPLYDLQHTGPWTWHGWQTSLQDAMHQSFTTTMQGQPVSSQDAWAVLAYLQSLKTPSNPYRHEDGSLNEAAMRGRTLFVSAKAGCANCHSGPHLTDGKVHDVGTGSRDDVYQGYNTPSLNGLYRKVRFLHDGRAGSLHEVLTLFHVPHEVGGEGELSEQEVSDLIEYLKSL